MSVVDMTLQEMKELMEAWLDERIEAYNALGKEFNPEGRVWDHYYECPRCIEVHPSDKQIHVSDIDTIAIWLGTRVDSENMECSDGVKYEKHYIVYRGYKLFEVRNVRECEVAE